MGNSCIIFNIISVLLWGQRTLMRLIPSGQNCSTDKPSSSSLKQGLSSLVAWMLYIQNYLFITFLIWMLKWYLPFLKQHLSVLVKSVYFWNYLPCARSHTAGNDSWVLTQVPLETVPLHLICLFLFETSPDRWTFGYFQNTSSMAS